MSKDIKGDNANTPVEELKWMAEFLATHGQPKKALEIYRALVESMSKNKSAEAQPKGNETDDHAA